MLPIYDVEGWLCPHCGERLRWRWDNGLLERYCLACPYWVLFEIAYEQPEIVPDPKELRRTLINLEATAAKTQKRQAS